MPAVGIAGVVGDVMGKMSVHRHAIVRTLVETVPPPSLLRSADHVGDDGVS